MPKEAVMLSSLKGEHAAIYLAKQDGVCTTSEVNTLYSENQLKEMIANLSA